MGGALTPGARVAAAIEILDIYLDGMPAEQALTGWGRRHRFAGSKDRAAIRDHVFDALRRLRSSGAMGGAPAQSDLTGRAIMIGLLRSDGIALDTLFHGEGYGPDPLSEEEQVAPDTTDMSRATRLDCPDWLLPYFDESLGEKAEQTLEALRHRAPVFLRVNKRLASRDEAQESLALEAIETRPHPLSEMALEVTSNPRKVSQSQAFLNGLVELQDAASQAVVEALGITKGLRVLDYCAGGGGKSLAMAALGAEVVAHDIAFDRMKDIPARAERAGVKITCATTQELDQMAQFDLVFADAPCSGSGSWRRTPHGKWLLTSERLDELLVAQRDILSQLSKYQTQDGRIAYATCSVFDAENTDQISDFCSKHKELSLRSEKRFSPTDGGDGFYIACLEKA
jgi:16S rRNA (cytosine967-C5)-methyltransferase